MTKKDYLSATQIAVSLAEKNPNFKLTASKVNDALKLIGFFEKDNELNEVQVGKNANGKEYSFFKWSKKLLDESTFLSALGLDNSIKETFLPVVKKNPLKIDRHRYLASQYLKLGKMIGGKVDEEKIEKFSKNIRKLIRSKNGVHVNSRVEAMIANYFESIGLPYEYEKQLTLIRSSQDGTKAAESRLPDFYIEFVFIEDNKLRKVKIYIELWGNLDERYLLTKEEKIEFYKEAGIILVEFNQDELAEDFESIFLPTINLHESLGKETFQSLYKKTMNYRAENMF